MSYETTIEETASLIRKTAIEVTWQQWTSLGASALAAPERRLISTIDPEALLLLSLVVQHAENRLVDFADWWAKVGSEFLSVQRTKTLIKHFPQTVVNGLDRFSCLALESGDRRWKRFISGNEPRRETRRLKGAEVPRMRESSTLMIRLRAGFGVNAKADTLAFLLGIKGESVTVQEISNAISYSKVAVRNALGDMTLAHLVRETPTQPTRYFVHVEPWTELLDLKRLDNYKIPQWAYWHQVNAFLAHSYTLFHQKGPDKKSTYILSSKARDIAAEFGSAFTKNRIDIPNPSDYRGVKYIEGFLETVRCLKSWANINI